MTYYVYILECADGTLYTGVTKDLKKRIDRHNRGDGARYTRGRVPVTFVYLEESDTIKSALMRERHLRKMPRAKKRELIDAFQNGHL